MRAIVISRQGTPVSENVQLVADWPEPTPGPGDAVVRTEASALNHLDLWVGQGVPGMDLTYPRISGSDAAGVVEAVGAGVDESWIGRRVLLNAAVPKPPAGSPDDAPTLPEISMIGEHVDGALAERFTAPVANLAPLGRIDAVEAAAAGLTFLTAWRMLRTRARLRPGAWVLVTGIGGGVALACLAIARHLGCRTIVTSRHRWKLDRAAELGAEHGVLDTGEEFARAVRRLTGRRGVDVCADSIGRAVHLSCLKSLARDGVLVTCGCTSGPVTETDLARIFWNQLTVIGSTMGDMDEFREIVSLLEAGAVRPVIDGVFDPADAPAAFRRLESADQFGKIVIRW
ncbi:MAG: zinc-binding dehydrogenase [Planctomycetota bacterium]|jgi:NADPH:quinone reductase-like Zn-dependent oxidoreductase